MGTITDRVIRDVSHIVTRGGADVEVTLTPPGGSSFTVRGIPVRINRMVEEHEGSYVNTPFSHITVIEKDLINAGFSPRINKLATLKNWQVSWTDAVQTWTYTVSETLPDDTFGTISLVLKDDN